MKFVDVVIEQCRNPKGVLGKVMLRNMNVIDSGLTKWCLTKIDDFDGCFLEIGCGSGRLIGALCKHSPTIQIKAIDTSKEAVKLSKKRNQKYGDHSIEISQGNVESLSFKDTVFDCVIANRSHYFWDNLDTSISEIYRVLKLDGVLLLLGETDKIRYHMTSIPIDAFKRLLLEKGFRSVTIDYKKGCICFKAIK